MKSLFNFFIPSSLGTDLGLLVLRLSLGLSMLFLHGLGKLQNFAAAKESFPDPIGLGSQTSLILVIFAEVFCAAMLALGLLTRFAAIVNAFVMAVAFFIVKKAALTGDNNGELPFLFGLGFLAIFLAGPGKISLDRLLGLAK